MDTNSIGIFDSGMGGVSLLRNAIRMLPNENYIFYGDNANAPYGDRSEDDILRLTSNAADFLLGQGVKALVLACNTATSASISVLRQKLDVPVVSIEPSIKPACLEAGDGKVLMLATVATTKLSRYNALKARMPDPDRVISVGCSGIVDRIERGIIDEDAFDDILHECLARYEGMKFDSIVLGCTHFVFICDAIERYAKKHFTGACRLWDGNEATVRQLGRVLEQCGLINCCGSAQAKFYTSGDYDKLYPLFLRLLNTPIRDYV